MTTETTSLKSNKRVFEGVIVEAQPNDLYLVHLERGYSIQAHIAPTMRKFNVRVLPGDNVVIELSPFDISRGKIIQRAN